MPISWRRCLKFEVWTCPEIGIANIGLEACAAVRTRVSSWKGRMTGKCVPSIPGSMTQRKPSGFSTRAASASAASMASIGT